MAYKNDHEGNPGWVGFATKEGVRDMDPGQHLFTGILVGHYGDNMAEFEEAIVQAYENGAKGVTFFTVNALTDKHVAIIRKYNELYNQ